MSKKCHIVSFWERVGRVLGSNKKAPEKSGVIQCKKITAHPPNASRWMSCQSKENLLDQDSDLLNLWKKFRFAESWSVFSWTVEPYISGWVVVVVAIAINHRAIRKNTLTDGACSDAGPDIQSARSVNFECSGILLGIEVVGYSWALMWCLIVGIVGMPKSPYLCTVNKNPNL